MGETYAEHWTTADDWGVTIVQGDNEIVLSSQMIEDVRDELDYGLVQPERCSTGFCEAYIARRGASHCAGCEDQE